MFDLSQFEKAPIFAPDNQIGVVLSLPLVAVTEDPTQPRTEFDEKELAKLVEDIGRRGVQSPIAVRPPVDGVYQIIHGARRFRASGLAGLPNIPAIIQPDESAFDDYSQVLENTQRDNLSPMDIARFIQKRKALGESNSQIARNLSENPEWVTYHLALIDLPPDIQHAYDAGQIKGAKAAYELRKLHGKDAHAVRKLVDSGKELTQARIRESANQAKPVVAAVLDPATPSAPSESANPLRSEPPIPIQPNEAAKTDAPPIMLKSPCVFGIYQGGPVQVLIELKPSEFFSVWVRRPNSSGPEEVLAEQITLSRIEEKHL